MWARVARATPHTPVSRQRKRTVALPSDALLNIERCCRLERDICVVWVSVSMCSWCVWHLARTMPSSDQHVLAAQLKKRDQSPCVDVCKYHGPKGWCIACGLTSNEFKNWKRMKPFGRKALLKKLERRKSDLKAKGLFLQ